ncbi:hypothetical protein G6F65_018591 [Rhizopus arrhizus]|nr:hypothetical protein G6F65_018591 [Rhizopus arrhizus]
MREAAMARQEKPRYNGAARELGLPYKDDPNRVIRFKHPLEGTVVFDDLIKGRIEIANSELDDMVIFRPDGYPTYNFAVVVDDWDMGITEVIRGDDHINNTPRQINLYEGIGAPVPKFGHMPMILDEQGAKLSKRTGAADVMQYKDAGYLPDALLSYLARLGWSHGLQFQGLAPGHGQAGLGQPALPEDRGCGCHRAAPGLPAAEAGPGRGRRPRPGGRGDRAA